MTPEGYRKINEALPSSFMVWPIPKDGEDCPFVTIKHIDSLRRGQLLNSMAEGDLLLKPEDEHYRGKGKPLLMIAAGMATENTITFVDLDSPASDGMLPE
jgi:hypothetical protein